MSSIERKRWNEAFKATWTRLRLEHDSTIVLTPPVAAVARQLRDKGNRPGTTAAGLYFGMLDAKRAELGGLN